VAPAAIGQLVRRLEETLGVELFHRAQSGPARLVATEAAKAAIPGLQEGFTRLAAAMDRLRSDRCCWTSPSYVTVSTAKPTVKTADGVCLGGVNSSDHLCGIH